MELPFDPVVDFQVLETFYIDENKFLPSLQRLYTPERQLDSVFTTFLLQGESIQKATHKASMLMDTHNQITKYDEVSSRPVPQNSTALPLQRNPFPNWIVPVFHGKDIHYGDGALAALPADVQMVNQPAEPSERIRATDMFVPEAVDSTQTFFTPADRTEPLEGLYFGYDADMNPTPKRVRLLAADEQFLVWQDMETKVFQRQKVITRSAESFPIAGWLIYPPTSDLKYRPDILPSDVLREISPSDLFHQQKPVLVDQYLNLQNLAPGLLQILAPFKHFHPTHSKIRTLLAAWGLEPLDIPYSLWTALYSEGIHPPSAQEGDSKAEEEPAPTTPAATIRLPPAYGTMGAPQGMNPWNWFRTLPDGGSWLRTYRLYLDLKTMDEARRSMPRLGDAPRELPLTSLQECMDASSFIEFRSRGLFRPQLGQCLPLQQILWEEDTRRTKDRISLTDMLIGLQQNMQKTSKTLSSFFEAQLSKFAPIEQSRKDVDSLVFPERAFLQQLLNNEDLLPSERVAQIEAWLHGHATEWTLVNMQYIWGSTSQKVLCKHELEYLVGADRDSFWSDWTREDPTGAYQMCKYCLEIVGLGARELQQKFDEHGRPIQTHTEIRVVRPLADAAAAAAALPTLEQSLFMSSSVEGAMAYGLKTVGQVVFELEWLASILPLLQQTTQSLWDGPLRAVKSNDQLFATYRRMMGIVWFLLLLKTSPIDVHARRSFPKNPLTREGVPTDMSDRTIEHSPALQYSLGLFAVLSQRTTTGDAADPLFELWENAPVELHNRILQMTFMLLGVFKTPLRFWTKKLKDEQQLSEDSKGSQSTGTSMKLSFTFFAQTAPLDPTRAQSLDPVVEVVEHQNPYIPLARPPKIIPIFEDLLDALLSKTKGHVEKALAGLPNPNATFSLSLKRDDISRDVFQILHTRALFALIVSVGSTLVSQQAILRPDGAGFALKEYRAVMNLVDSTPKVGQKDRHNIATYLETILSFLSFADLEVDSRSRLSIAQRCLGLLLQEAKRIYGAAWLDSTVAKWVDWNTPLLRFSPKDLATEYAKRRAIERQRYVERMGKLSDSERLITRELQDLGLVDSLLGQAEERSQIAEELDIYRGAANLYAQGGDADADDPESLAYSTGRSVEDDADEWEAGDYETMVYDGDYD